MAGFNESTRTRSAFTLPTGPEGTLAQVSTHEGASAYARSPQADLFMLGVTFMVGEPSFYETGDARMERFRHLIRASLREDPVWTARFVGALRSAFNIRTASIVAAAEFALAVRELRNWSEHTQADQRRVERLLREAGISVRSVVDSALQRADEPAEFVAYWKLRTADPRRIRRGSQDRPAVTLPGGVQRGVADAARRLFREYTAIKYDGTASAVRMGDVLEIAHPTPSAPWQGDLFQYLLDRRHHSDSLQVDLERLPMIVANRWMRSIPAESREEMIKARLRQGTLGQLLEVSGMTWEEFGSWLGRPLKAAEWEALIPSMGYMALLRHLRQFDEVGISDQAVETVAARLEDPAEVARSRQFPYRFMSAYAEVPSDRWSSALEHALGLSCANLPALDGRTLVLVDTSASMEATVTQRSKVRRMDVGALFAAALAVKAQQVPGASVALWEFASTVARWQLPRGASVLRQVRRFGADSGRVGHGTNIPLAAQQFTDHKRVVLFTDGQTMAQYGSGRGAFDHIPAEVPVIVFNLAGYGNSLVDPQHPNRIELGGFTDAAFRMLALLDAGPEGMGELVAPREVEGGQA